MEKVCPEALQMIGYRIPTEDKYSCAPIKIVGFLPREAGEGIMLPYDITLLTGSDFDVDKEYLMRKVINIKPKPFNESFEILFPEFLEAKKKESKLERDFTKQEKIWLKREFTEMLNTFIGNEKIEGEIVYNIHNYQREAISSDIENFAITEEKIADKSITDTKISQDGTLTGDPTETALVDMAFKLSFDPSLYDRTPRVQEIPFDSDRKLMTTVNQLNGKYVVFTKGGIDELLKSPNCTD